MTKYDRVGNCSTIIPITSKYINRKQKFLPPVQATKSRKITRTKNFTL